MKRFQISRQRLTYGLAIGAAILCLAAIILGEDPSSAITSGSSNILIGNSLTALGSSGKTTNSQLDIGDTIYGGLGSSGTLTFAGAATIDGAFTVENGATINGTLTAADAATVDGTFSANGSVLLTGLSLSGSGSDTLCISSGEIYYYSGPCSSSQRKPKENFASVDESTALADIMALKPTRFNLKATTPPNPDPNATNTQYGFIAEEVAAIDPRLTFYENDMKTPRLWRQDSVIALLVKVTQQQQKNAEGELRAAQEMQKEIDDLKAELKTLRGQQAK